MKSEKDGPFTPDVMLCGTCEKEDATHEITIYVRKGVDADYSSRKQLFSVTYAVCGACAREVVEVKLGAQLKATQRR